MPLSAVGFGLKIEQFGVAAGEGEEVVVGAVFDDFAVFEDEDAVGETDGAEAMADKDGRFAFG